MSDLCPAYAPFFSALGCAFSIVFCTLGASYGTAKSSIGISSVAVLRPNEITKSCLPVAMSGIVAIYGLVVSVVINGQLKQQMSLYQTFLHLGSGLAVGLSGLAAGFAIGIAGDAGVRSAAQQPKMFTGMVLILIFAEVLGLYGLVVAMLMTSSSKTSSC